MVLRSWRGATVWIDDACFAKLVDQPRCTTVADPQATLEEVDRDRPMFLGDAHRLVVKLVARIGRLELLDLLEQRRLAHGSARHATGGRQRGGRCAPCVRRLARAAVTQVAGIERRRLVARRLVLDSQLARLVGANPAPVADELVDLVVAEIGTLDAFELGGVRRHEEHVAAAEQPLGARHVEDHAAVGLAGDGKGDAGGEVGLDQAGDDIHRWTLRGDDQVNADGTRHLRHAADVFFDLFGRSHHQVGHLVHDDDDDGQRLLAALLQVGIVARQVAGVRPC